LLDQKNRLITTLKTSNEHLEQSKLGLVHVKDSLESEQLRMQNEIGEQRDLISFLKSENNELRTQLDSQNERFEDAQKVLSANKEKIISLENGLNEIRKDSQEKLEVSQKSLEDKIGQLNQVLEEVQVLKGELSIANESSIFYKLKIETLSNEIREKDQSLNEQEELIKMQDDYALALKANIKSLEDDIEDFRSIDEIFELKK
jgi:DNA recombination protein RmuC